MLISLRIDLSEVVSPLDQPAFLLQERKKVDKSVDDTGAPVHFKEKQSRKDHSNRHKEVETIDDRELEKGWRTNVNIDEEYAEQVGNFEQASRFLRNVGRTVRPNLCGQEPYRIEHRKHTAFNCTRYRAGPKHGSSRRW